MGPSLEPKPQGALNSRGKLAEIQADHFIPEEAEIPERLRDSPRDVLVPFCR